MPHVSDTPVCDPVKKQGPRQGACSICQEIASVRFQPQADLDDEQEIRMQFGEAGLWVMDQHWSFGSLCEGSGTTPLALVGK